VYNLIVIDTGEGNFGRVYKARANDIIPGDNVRNIVAVKTLKGERLLVINAAPLWVQQIMLDHLTLLTWSRSCTS